MEPDELGGDPSLGLGLEYSRLISEGMSPVEARETIASRSSATELESRLREENAELRRTIDELATRIGELEARLDGILARLDELATETAEDEDTENPDVDTTDADTEDEEGEGDDEDEGGEDEDDGDGEDTDDDTEPSDVAPVEPYVDSDLPERIRDSDVRVAEAAREFDVATREFARLRVLRERPFGGRHQEALNRAGQRLVEATEELQAAMAEQENLKDIGFEQREEEINIQKRYLARRIQLARVEADRASADGDLDRLEETSQRLLELERRDNELDRQLMGIGHERGQNQIAMNERINQMVIETQQRVDTEMEAERERRHPRLAKMGRWFRRHPFARAVASVGMSAIAITGFATGNVPLIALGTAGRMTFGAIGGYNIGAGGGEFFARRGYNSSTIENMNDYVGAATRQSGTRSSGKTIGVGLGAILATIPLVRGLSYYFDRPSVPTGSGAGSHPPTGDGPPKPPPVPETPTPDVPHYPNPGEIATHPGTDEWNYVAYNKGVGGQAWGKIIEMKDALSKEGWQFQGRNLHFPVDATGPGSGHVETIIAPDGTTYSGHGAVNGILGKLIDTRFGTGVPSQYLE